MLIVHILLIVAFGALCFFGISAFLTKKRISKEFRRGNVIVFGKKGKGKDLLFQTIICDQKKDYYSNITYGYKFHHIDLKELELEGNTFHNFINGTIKKVDPSKYPFEERDIYISEGGLLLPSQYDTILHKTYPSLPISYALSRHLWNNNIHYNSQSLERAWKALREQADYFVMCRGVIKLPFFLVIKTREFDKYETAKANILPMKNLMFNKFDKALVAQHKATYGLIKDGFVIIRKNKIRYDTRYFKKLIFEENPSIPTSQRKESCSPCDDAMALGVDSSQEERKDVKQDV